MTTPEPPVAVLRKLMAVHGLTQREVAEIACVGLKTCEGWLADPSSVSFRRMPPRHLNAILAMLPGFIATKRSRKRRKARGENSD